MKRNIFAFFFILFTVSNLAFAQDAFTKRSFSSQDFSNTNSQEKLAESEAELGIGNQKSQDKNDENQELEQSLESEANTAEEQKQTAVVNTKLGPEKIKYKNTKLHAQISAYISSQPSTEAIKALSSLAQVKKLPKTAVLQIFMVGAFDQNFDTKFQKLLAELAQSGVAVHLEPSLPEESKLQYSPVWIIETDQAKNIYEGDFDLIPMFDKKGFFQEPILK